MKRIQIILLMMLALLVLTSCTNNTSDKILKDLNVPAPKVVEFIEQDRKFEIIPLYKEVLHYTASIKKDPSLDNKEEHHNKVITPFYNVAIKKNLSVLNDISLIIKPTLLEQQLEENTIALLNNQDKINALIQEAIKSSVELLKGGHKTIFIMPLNPDNTTHLREAGGVTGYALSRDAFILNIDPTFSKELLKYSVAHEYNHTVAMENLNLSDHTILNSVILEGKADVFASMVYPDFTWHEPLSADSEQIVLEAIRTHMNINSNMSDFSTVFDDLLEGNYNKGIPELSIYKIGKTIMQSYLKNNPEVTISNWTRFKAEQIVRGSDYQELLQ